MKHTPVDKVMHEIAFLFANQQIRFTQNLQMLGDGRFRNANLPGQCTDTIVALQKKFENVHPGFIRYCFQDQRLFHR